MFRESLSVYRRVFLLSSWYCVLYTTLIHMQKHTIQIQGDSVVQIRTYNKLLASIFRHEERDTIPTMLTPFQRAVRLMMFKISVGRDSKNLTAVATVPPQLYASMAETQLSSSMVQSQLSTDSFSKSSNSQNHLFLAWRHPHSSPISCLGVYYDIGYCHILCARV